MTPPPLDTPRDVDPSAPWLILLLSLALAGPASAALRSRLAPEVVARCPSDDALNARWQARAPAGDPAVELHIFAQAGGLVGIVRAEAPGQPPAARRLKARRDGCSALADALLTAAALLTVPIELPPPPTAPAAPPDDPPEPPPEPPPDHPGRWHLALGARGELGAAPGPSAIGELALGHRIGALAIGGGLHVGVAPTTAVGAGEVRIERYGIRLDGCWRPGAFGLCGFGRAGVLAIRPHRLDGADRVEALADVGARAAWFIAASPSWSAALDLELIAPLRPLRLTVDGRAAWQASPVALGLGLSVEWSR